MEDRSIKQLCVKSCVTKMMCDKVVCKRLCVCVSVMVCSKHVCVCGRWCMTKLPAKKVVCVKDGVSVCV